MSYMGVNKAITSLFSLVLTALPMVAATDNNKTTDTINWCATTIDKTAGGQTITNLDLVGRVVLLAQFPLNDKDEWNTFVVRETMEFINAAPPGSLVPLLVVNKDANIAAWQAKKGSPTASFVTQETLHIPDFIWGGGPRYILVDADGVIVSDMIIDGRNLSGGSRYKSRGILMKPNDVMQTVENGPGSIVPPGDWKTCKAERADLIEASITSKPIAPILKSLRKINDDSKDKVEKTESGHLIDAIEYHVKKQLAVAEKNRKDDPVFFMEIINRLTLQLGKDELAKHVENISEKLSDNKSFQEDLKSMEDFNKVLRSAAVIYFGCGDPDAERPAAQIKAIRSGLNTVIKRHPKSRGAYFAELYTEKWDTWVAKAIYPLPW